MTYLEEILTKLYSKYPEYNWILFANGKVRWLVDVAEEERISWELVAIRDDASIKLGHFIEYFDSSEKVQFLFSPYGTITLEFMRILKEVLDIEFEIPIGW